MLHGVSNAKVFHRLSEASTCPHEKQWRRVCRTMKEGGREEVVSAKMNEQGDEVGDRSLRVGEESKVCEEEVKVFEEEVIMEIQVSSC